MGWNGNPHIRNVRTWTPRRNPRGCHGVVCAHLGVSRPPQVARCSTRRNETAPATPRLIVDPCSRQASRGAVGSGWVPVGGKRRQAFIASNWDGGDEGAVCASRPVQNINLELAQPNHRHERDRVAFDAAQERDDRRQQLLGFAFSWPPLRSLTLRPGHSLTVRIDGFVDALQKLGFPHLCLPSYGASSSYPGGSVSR